MSKLEIKQEYTLKLNIEELRLVLKALGGRLKYGDIQRAKEFGDTLSVEKVVAVRQISHENEKLARSLTEVGVLPNEEEISLGPSTMERGESSE